MDAYKTLVYPQGQTGQGEHQAHQHLDAAAPDQAHRRPQQSHGRTKEAPAAAGPDPERQAGCQEEAPIPLCHLFAL